MDIHRGGGDRYAVDPNAFHPYRHPPREGGPLLSRFSDDRPYDSSLSRYSEFEVPLRGQNRQFPLYDQPGVPPPDRYGGSSFETRNFNAFIKQSEGGSSTKLFVSSIPQTATENDIRTPFEEHGNIVDVALIRDTRTGQHNGCCFVKYATSEEANRAIRFLHNNYILPGGVGPIQVRYADKEHEQLGADEFTLFVTSLNKQATEKEVKEIFLPYGRVEDVYLMRDEMNQSRGCGFVKFLDGNIAVRAKNALNEIYTMRGCEQPLTVRFADLTKPPHAETRLPRLDDSAWHPVSQHGMAPSYDVGMHGYGSHVAPRYGDVYSAPLQTSSQAQAFSTVRPVGQSQLQGPNFGGQSQTSFSQGLPLQPMRSIDRMLPHYQAQSSHMQPLHPSLTRQQIPNVDPYKNTSTSTNTTTFSLRLILEKDKLTGPNFTDWERNLRIVLRHERILYVLDTKLGKRPPFNATQTVINAYEKHRNDSIDVSCLMLATMSPDLQKNLENMEAYDMIHTLKEMFQNKSVNVDQQKASKMNKGKKVLMVRQGRVDKKSSKDKSKKVVGKSNTKPKSETITKKKVKPNTARTENRCFGCGEVGHWKRNCSNGQMAGDNASSLEGDGK